jgi:hypothetical protein
MASSPRGTPIKLPSEPVLDGVLDEDRQTVRNVIYVLHALKLCQSWSVTPKNQTPGLRYMFLRGIQLVRGWKYTQVQMPEEDVEDAEQNNRELFDLCRRCGHPGHFITHCNPNFDGMGRACKP